MAHNSDALNRIILIQHCQSEHHVNGMTGGWTDTPLTHLGRQQAAAIAARLKRDLAGTPCRLYASDLKRAAQTAEIVAEELALTVQHVPGLREFNGGAATGRTRQWAEENMLSNDGHFYYQRLRHYTKRFSLMRWCQSWMCYALSELQSVVGQAEKLSKEE